LAALEYVLLGLFLFSIPFVLPIAGWVSARRTRRRVAALESVVLRQAEEIRRLVSACKSSSALRQATTRRAKAGGRRGSEPAPQNR
jgi:hypothetical protein